MRKWLKKYWKPLVLLLIMGGFLLYPPLVLTEVRIDFEEADYSAGKHWKALTSFTPSGYRKGGYHYTADGTLIRWHEFSKKSGALVLENLSETTKQTLEYICDENIFLTFLFYGAYDLSQSGQYALTADFKAELNRLSGLWNVYLEITEK